MLLIQTPPHLHLQPTNLICMDQIQPGVEFWIPVESVVALYYGASTSVAEGFFVFSLSWATDCKFVGCLTLDPGDNRSRQPQGTLRNGNIWLTWLYLWGRVVTWQSSCEAGSAGAQHLTRAIFPSAVLLITTFSTFNPLITSTCHSCMCKKPWQSEQSSRVPAFHTNIPPSLPTCHCYSGLKSVFIIWEVEHHLNCNKHWWGPLL